MPSARLCSVAITVGPPNVKGGPGITAETASDLRWSQGDSNP